MASRSKHFFLRQGMWPKIVTQNFTPKKRFSGHKNKTRRRRGQKRREARQDCCHKRSTHSRNLAHTRPRRSMAKTVLRRRPDVLSREAHNLFCTNTNTAAAIA
uniref:(northern house mosquito) hypothetical protein n=1 Tax=Culex pipiens TaxID=7175 RepID=A0A8D8FS84_CULPI